MKYVIVAFASVFAAFTQLYGQEAKKPSTEQQQKVTDDELKKYAEGRVWTGSDALKIKLVDKLGGINDAIKLAALKAGLKEEYSVVCLPEQKSGFWKRMILDMANGDEESTKETFLKKELGFMYPYISSVKDIENLKGVQARMLYKLVIK